MAITSKSVKTLLACGVIGPLFFIVVFLIEGATRAGYNPLRIPVSSLSIGEFGWMQNVNFLITGSLVVAFVIGLRQALRLSGGSSWLPLLIGLVGVGLIGAGFFNTDPANGFPPGSPLVPTVATTTTHGTLHNLFSLPVFTALPAACFVFARRSAKSGRRGWMVYSILAGIGMLAFFVLAGIGIKQTPGFVEVVGVYQRLSIAIGFTWITAIAVYLSKATVQDSVKW
ncbi:MAG: DUF998 domain-containing protein [Spirochaetia bacterium]